jgi:hypothetical protein
VRIGGGGMEGVGIVESGKLVGMWEKENNISENIHNKV